MDVETGARKEKEKEKDKEKDIHVETRIGIGQTFVTVARKLMAKPWKFSKVE